ncbi:MAG: 5-formyltetrahydrofolate cyclo-ligase [Hyphomicrobiaceae bacterium]|nr:5-formyltetrahydrofolate cyclo-ligase [Hyphomicrobiaceae bacterium]
MTAKSDGDRSLTGAPLPPTKPVSPDDGAHHPGPAEVADIPRWRRAERTRLRNERMAQSVETRSNSSQLLADHIFEFVSERFSGASGRVFSGYWPIKGEPNLRPVMIKLHEAGVLVALPVVEVKASPMVFRRWTPDTKMVRGDWNIPVPPPEAELVLPDITLAPLVGWDRQGYRLGYGGGYFDRTLASLNPRPFTIGVGWQAAHIQTIYPQPHDISLDVIITENGLQLPR